YSALFMCLSRPSMPVESVERSTVRSTVPLVTSARSTSTPPAMAEVRPTNCSTGASLMKETRSLPPPPSNRKWILSAWASAPRRRPRRTKRWVRIPLGCCGRRASYKSQAAPLEENVRGDGQSGQGEQHGHDIERAHGGGHILQKRGVSGH